MPNRILREKIIKSDKVNMLSWAAEVFYRRLMSVVDDFGLYDARASLLRTDLFGLRIDKVPESDIVKWMTECSEAGLIRLYNVDDKPYLEVLQFNQTIRVKKSKYPSPDTHVKLFDMQITADDTQKIVTCVPGDGEGKGKGFGGGEGYAPPSSFSHIAVQEGNDHAKEAANDQGFLARCWQMGLKGDDKVKEALQEFLLHIKSLGKPDSNREEFRKHFFNWLPKSFLNKKKEITGHDQWKESLEKQRRLLGDG